MDIPSQCPCLGHLACFDECWVWIANLLLRPLENMEGDHNLPFFLETFHLKLCSRDLTFEALTLEIFPLKFSKILMKICSLDIFPWKFEIFFFFEDLSFKHLKIKKRKKEKKKEIYSWRFFLWNMEIFPWRFIQKIFPLQFWKTLIKICP